MEKTDIVIGEKIKQVMLERHVTKAKLSRLLGIKPQSVDYMLGRKSIDTDTLYNVSKALNYDFAKLYEFSDDKKMSDNGEDNAGREISAKLILEISLDGEDLKKLDLTKLLDKDLLSKIVK